MWVEKASWIKAGSGVDTEIISGHFKDTSVAAAIADEIQSQGIDAEITVVGGGTLAVFVFDAQAFLSTFPGIKVA